MDYSNSINTSCPNCGATVSTEICPYCNAPTGINNIVQDVQNNEAVINCKEANINYFGIVFPLIFAIIFGFFGFGMPLIFAMIDIEGLRVAIAVCTIFAMVSIVATLIVIKNLVRFLIIKIKGEEINGIVCGYMNDNLFINNVPAQIVKVRIDTPEGPKIALYQTKDVNRPYGINQTIKLKVYKDIYYIEPHQNMM